MNHFRSIVERWALVTIFSLILICSENSRATEAPKPAEPPKPEYKPYLRIMPDRALQQSDRDLIDAAMPTEAPAKPQKPRKLLVFDLNVDYDGHRSIVCANHAFKTLGARTKAFETVIAHEEAAFDVENLKQFDAVVFNNTVGNVVSDAVRRKNLHEFVQNGGGLLAVHAATEAFIHYGGEQVGKDDWPVFGEMIGARGMKHRETDERVFVRIEDLDHPLTRMFPKEGFAYREEILRFREPYSRKSVRVLLSMDNVKSNLRRPPFGELKERTDEDYALVWVREYGKGRCCYSAFGHNPYVFWDAAMLRFYLAAIQFVLGDLEASTVSSIPPPTPVPAPPPTPPPAPAM